MTRVPPTQVEYLIRRIYGRTTHNRNQFVLGKCVVNDFIGCTAFSIPRVQESVLAIYGGGGVLLQLPYSLLCFVFCACGCAFFFCCIAFIFVWVRSERSGSDPVAQDRDERPGVGRRRHQLLVLRRQQGHQRQFAHLCPGPPRFHHHRGNPKSSSMPIVFCCTIISPRNWREVQLEYIDMLQPRLYGGHLGFSEPFFFNQSTINRDYFHDLNKFHERFSKSYILKLCFI